MSGEGRPGFSGLFVVEVRATSGSGKKRFADNSTSQVECRDGLMEFMGKTDCIDAPSYFTPDSDINKLGNPAGFGTIGDRLDIFHEPSWMARLRLTTSGMRSVVCMDASDLLGFMRQKNIGGALPFSRVRAFLLGCGPDMINDLCKAIHVYTATIGTRSLMYQPYGSIVIERTGTNGDTFGLMMSPMVKLTDDEVTRFTTMAEQLGIPDSKHPELIEVLKQNLRVPSSGLPSDPNAQAEDAKNVQAQLVVPPVSGAASGAPDAEVALGAIAS
jgi:hypothetical protein